MLCKTVKGGMRRPTVERLSWKCSCSKNADEMDENPCFSKTRNMRWGEFGLYWYPAFATCLIYLWSWKNLHEAIVDVLKASLKDHILTVKRLVCLHSFCIISTTAHQWNESPKASTTKVDFVSVNQSSIFMPKLVLVLNATLFSRAKLQYWKGKMRKVDKKGRSRGCLFSNIFYASLDSAAYNSQRIRLSNCLTDSLSATYL